MAKAYKLKHPNGDMTEHMGYSEFRRYLDSIGVGKTQIFESLDKQRPTRAGYQLLEIYEKEEEKLVCDLCGKEINTKEVGGYFENYPQCKECWDSWHGAKEENIIENKRILVIPDLHAPFTKDGYLEFCKSIYEKYKCNMVISTGDLIDMHFSSYHETNPDGYSAKDELVRAKEVVKRYYEAFPKMLICEGNHDLIFKRKALTSGLSSAWLKTMNDVLEVPNWIFKEYFIIDNILFYHGEGQNINTKAQQEMISCVCGHNHSKSSITFFQSRLGKRIFAMQLGTGINQDAYAFAYNKHGKPAHVNVGVIIDGTPIIEYME